MSSEHRTVGALTWREAARFLRLDIDADGEPRSEKATRRALDRLVESKRLRPCMYAKHRLYRPAELERFLAVETERYGAGSER